MKRETERDRKREREMPNAVCLVRAGEHSSCSEPASSGGLTWCRARTSRRINTWSHIRFCSDPPMAAELREYILTFGIKKVNSSAAVICHCRAFMVYGGEHTMKQPPLLMKMYLKRLGHKRLQTR